MGEIAISAVLGGIISWFLTQLYHSKATIRQDDSDRRSAATMKAEIKGVIDSLKSETEDLQEMIWNLEFILDGTTKQLRELQSEVDLTRTLVAHGTLQDPMYPYK